MKYWLSSPLQGALRSFSNLKDVGIVQVKVMRAEGLMVADVIGNQKYLLYFILLQGTLYFIYYMVLHTACTPLYTAMRYLNAL